MLRGLHKILTGQTAQYVIQPIIFAVGIGYFYLYGFELTPKIAMTISAIGWCVAMVIAIVLLKRSFKPSQPNNTKPLIANTFLRTTLVFAIITGVQMTNSRIDIVLLYWLGGESDAGVYSAAVRICDLLIFSIVAINISIGPSVATLFHSGEIEKLQILVKKTARTCSAITIPLLILAIFFAQPLIGLFGHGFSGYSTALIVLCVGQIVVVLTGSKALILLMSGEERISAVVLGTTAIAHLIISAILIPHYGIIGASISTTLSVICWSVWLTWVLIQKQGIDPTIFNIFSKVNYTKR